MQSRSQTGSWTKTGQQFLSCRRCANHKITTPCLPLNPPSLQFPAEEINRYPQHTDEQRRHSPTDPPWTAWLEQRPLSDAAVNTSFLRSSISAPSRYKCDDTRNASSNSCANYLRSFVDRQRTRLQSELQLSSDSDRCHRRTAGQSSILPSFLETAGTSSVSVRVQKEDVHSHPDLEFFNACSSLTAITPTILDVLGLLCRRKNVHLDVNGNPEY